MGKLADYTIDQVAGALALTLGSIGGLCLILFKSRCEKITICWGIWSCNRKVVDDDDGEKEVKQSSSYRHLLLYLFLLINPYQIKI